MAIKKCLYCGKGTLLHLKPSSDFYNGITQAEGLTELPDDLYQCDTCGIQCTQLEVDKVNEGQPYFATAPKNITNENELLLQAWELMQKKRWEEA